MLFEQIIGCFLPWAREQTAPAASRGLCFHCHLHYKSLAHFGGLQVLGPASGRSLLQAGICYSSLKHICSSVKADMQHGQYQSQTVPLQIGLKVYLYCVESVGAFLVSRKVLRCHNVI